MDTETTRRSWRAVAIFGALLLALAWTGCFLGDIVRLRWPIEITTPKPGTFSPLATPTAPIVRTPVRSATATPTFSPSATPTHTHTPSATPSPTRTPTRVPQTLRLVNPSFEEIQIALTDMVPGDRFQILLDDDRVTEEANLYMQEVEMPVTLTDLRIAFEPGQVKITAQVPLGFFSLGASATGVWRAVDCEFRAEVVDMRIAGQPAPATIRGDLEDALSDALVALADAPVCFTDVIIRNGEVEILGYRE